MGQLFSALAKPPVAGGRCGSLSGNRPTPKAGQTIAVNGGALFS
jgi:hypothetical protein